jgi:hypothetical protein
MNFDCKKIKEDDLSCSFNCTIETEKCENFVGRAVVTHSGWAAIYDESFKFTCKKSLIINLPKRAYDYVIRIGIKKGNNFEAAEKKISC